MPPHVGTNIHKWAAGRESCFLRPGSLALDRCGSGALKDRIMTDTLGIGTLSQADRFAFADVSMVGDDVRWVARLSQAPLVQTGLIQSGLIQSGLIQSRGGL